MKLQIKIKGYGTKRDIVIALKNLAHSINDETPEALATGKEFEDPILMTEVSEDNEEE